jgi:hypothetical protein
MSTEPKRTCPSCGNELSEGMEFCPVCMLRRALVGGVESGESATSENAIKRKRRPWGHPDCFIQANERTKKRSTIFTSRCRGRGESHLALIAADHGPQLVVEEFVPAVFAVFRVS